MPIQNTSAENGVTKAAENSVTGVIYGMGTGTAIDNQVNNPDNQGAGENHTDPAGINGPEDTGGMAETAQIIEAQGRQIEQLIEANSSLMQQIGVMLRSGAAITDNPPQPQPPTDPTKADDYVSLADLGKEIGQRSK